MIQITPQMRIVVAIEPADFRKGIDGQGFWLCYKRLSSGKLAWWPGGANAVEVAETLTAHQLHVLLAAGDPTRTQAAEIWRCVTPIGS